MGEGRRAAVFRARRYQLFVHSSERPPDCVLHAIQHVAFDGDRIAQPHREGELRVLISFQFWSLPLKRCSKRRRERAHALHIFAIGAFAWK